MQMDDGHLEQLDDKDLLNKHANWNELIQKNSDLVFHVGEQVKVKNGDFRIKSIGRKMIVLEGLPGTRLAI